MKNPSHWNTQLALDTLTALLSAGVEEFCICPGARNAPWIAVLHENPNRFRTYYFYEERCASFFALGRIKQTGKPVAVMTTSGTAVGELLPATMEAHYSGLPLVLLSADRPRHYRLSGAPQAAEQVNLFGIYSEPTLDIEKGEKLRLDEVTWKKPVHINVCFDEPLLEKKSETHNPYQVLEKIDLKKPLNSESSDLKELEKLRIGGQDFLNQVKNPLIIVGMLNSEERVAVRRLLQYWNVPAYFEGISGLRESMELREIQIRISDQIVERSYVKSYPIDGIIRLGGVPTLRLWRDLEEKYLHLPVLSLSSVPFSGLGRKSVHISGSMIELCFQMEKLLERHFNSPQNFDDFLKHDRLISDSVDQLLRDEPTSEPGLIAALSRAIPSGARVYLGNSMPIREWDLAASYDTQISDCWATRGLNGIDGQVSTFLGYSAQNQENWAIVGDLTALYDLSSPWILSQLENTQANIVVVNNEGGKIFSRMFPFAEFQNQHQIRFSAWAQLWGLHYQSWKEIPQNLTINEKSQIIELLPEEGATRRFWEHYQRLVTS